jgi:acyl carrier protein
LTINGKIDKKALTIDLSETNNNKTSELKELTSTQKKVLKIWQDIIKTKSLGINDNFFDVGGTSLLAVRVVDRIEKEFNIRFVLRNFFNYPIIQNIAEHIDILSNPVKIPEKNESIQKPDAGNIIIKGEL